MKLSMKLIATAVAVTIATSSMASPSSAFFFFGPPKFHFFFPKFPKLPKFPKYPKPPKSTPTSNTSGKSGSNAGPYVVGCIMGSALGLIGTSIYKARSLGFQYRWMTQAQYEAYERTRDRSIELTSQEAALIGFTCGLGAFPVMAKYNRR